MIPWRRFLPRFLLAVVVLGALSLSLEDRIVGALLPPFRAWLDLVDHSYRTVDLSLVQSHGETVIRRLAVPAHVHVIGRVFVYPDSAPHFSNQALAGIVLQPLVLALSALLAWPAASRREWALRFGLALLVLPWVVLLDVPLMLYGFAWFQELQALDPDRFSALVTWADAMNAGGRFVLAALAVILCVQASARCVRRAGPALTLPPRFAP